MPIVFSERTDTCTEDEIPNSSASIRNNQLAESGEPTSLWCDYSAKRNADSNDVNGDKKRGMRLYLKYCNY